MSDSITPNYSPSRQPPRRWKWWHIALGGVGLIVLLSLLGGGNPKLKVSVSRQGVGGYQRIEVINVGDKAVTVTGIQANDRADCRIARIDQITIANPPFDPVTLQIGQGNTWFTPCRIVRAKVTTSEGSATYEFAQ